MYNILPMYIQQNKAADFPSEIDNFYGKHMLFKVEVGDGNLIHNWRSYAVKRITDDEDAVKRFMVLHNIKVLCQYDINSLTLYVTRTVYNNCFDCCAGNY